MRAFHCALLFAALILSSLVLVPAALPGADAQAQSLIQQRNQANAEQQQPATRSSPSLWTRAVAYVRIQQQKFYRELTRSVKRIQTDWSFEAAWSLVVLSFLYGIFHAAGPGHGKAVISAYLLANERQVRRGILLAVASSLVQAMSAIALVTGFILLLGLTGRATQRSVVYLESVSYALICVVGVYMLWRVLSPLFRRVAQPAIAGHPHGHDHDHGHDHGHGHHRHDHDHGHNHHHHHDHNHHDHADGHCDHCGHAHMPTPEQADRATSFWQAASIVFSVGIRPCSGAVIVLIFANAVGLFFVGIGATFAMAAGTAITVSALAVLTLVSKNLATSLIGRHTAWVDITYRVLGVTGAVLVFLIGAILFTGSLGPTRPFI